MVDAFLLFEAFWLAHNRNNMPLDERLVCVFLVRIGWLQSELEDRAATIISRANETAGVHIKAFVSHRIQAARSMQSAPSIQRDDSKIWHLRLNWMWEAWKEGTCGR